MSRKTLVSEKNLEPSWLLELLVYNSRTGLFKWKKRSKKYISTIASRNSWNRRYQGKQAGSLQKNGYVYITLFGRKFPAHRIAWAMKKGSWPDLVIDHIDGNRSNNTIKNLREVSTKENNKNQRIRINNTSGITGVRFCIDNFGWIAEIGKDGDYITLGIYETVKEAVAARNAAELVLGYSSTHGRVEGTSRPSYSKQLE